MRRAPSDVSSSDGALSVSAAVSHLLRGMSVSGPSDQNTTPNLICTAFMFTLTPDSDNCWML